MKIAMAVESMTRHMTDEGWQIMLGLQHAGYHLCGHNLDGLTDVRDIIKLNPTTLVIQDKREWEGKTATRHDFNQAERFKNYRALKQRFDIFKVTIIKDAHQNVDYNRQASEEMGVKAWITYYKDVERFVPFANRIIRTYHTIDKDIVPLFNENKVGCLLSGAVSRAYPLRQRLLQNIGSIHGAHSLKHPGYHRKGCCTPDYLRILNHFKVAICTASIYDYALRKIFEATACGCVVITNLTEKLPVINENLIRISSDISIDDLNNILEETYKNYDINRQKKFAQRCKIFYDYRLQGSLLAHAIEKEKER